MKKSQTFHHLPARFDCGLSCLLSCNLPSLCQGDGGADMATVEAVRPAEPAISHQSSVGMFASYANLADLQDEVGRNSLFT